MILILEPKPACSEDRSYCRWVSVSWKRHQEFAL